LGGARRDDPRLGSEVGLLLRVHRGLEQKDVTRGRHGDKAGVSFLYPQVRTRERFRRPLTSPAAMRVTDAAIALLLGLAALLDGIELRTRHT
jgi:hypothetical protein